MQKFYVPIKRDKEISPIERDKIIKKLETSHGLMGNPKMIDLDDQKVHMEVALGGEGKNAIVNTYGRHYILISKKNIEMLLNIKEFYVTKSIMEFKDNYNPVKEDQIEPISVDEVHIIGENIPSRILAVLQLYSFEREMIAMMFKGKYWYEYSKVFLTMNDGEKFKMNFKVFFELFIN